MNTEDLNNTINHFDHTDINRTFHPTKAEYIFFQVHTEGGVSFRVFKSPALLHSLWIFTSASALNLLYIIMVEN